MTTKSHLFNSRIAPVPLFLSGEGVYVTLRDQNTGEERTLLDGSSGAAVSSVGHGDKEIIAAIADAAQKHVYTYPGAANNVPAEQLAEFLIENSPKGSFKAATFTCSGSEANENSLKIAKKYFVLKGETQRTKFISRKQAYHGSTIAALSLSDTARKAGFDEILLSPDLIPRASQCYPYRYKKSEESLEDYKNRLLEDLENVFIEAGPDTIAGFFVETVTGTAYGCNIPVPGYLDGCKAICEKYGALLILDEVMCGTGRTGSLHAWEQFMSSGPDLQTIGKCLAGGYVTLAGILISPKVMEVFIKDGKPTGIVQTFHCHGLNAAVGLAVQRKIKRDGLIVNIKEQGTRLGDQLKDQLQDCKYVGDVRGVGGFWAIEFVKDKKTKEPFDKDIKFSNVVKNRLYQNGLICLGLQGSLDNHLGDHIIFAPAFSITSAEVDKMVEIIVDTIKDIEKEY